MSDFFTAVSYGRNYTSRMERFIEGVDDYFYLGAKKKQCVIAGQENEKNKATVLLDQKTSFAFWKILSFLTGIVPLFMLALKGLLRCTHHYHIIDPKQKLQEGMNTPLETIQKVQETAGKLLGMAQGQINGKTQLADDPNGTKFIHDASVINTNLKAAFFFEEPQGVHTDTIQMYPDLGANALCQAEEQFIHMTKAKEACIYHNFDHLIIPHAAVIEAGSRKFIARESLEVYGSEIAQSSNPHTVAMMKESVRQLTRFAIETGKTGKICIKNDEDTTVKKIVLLDPKPVGCSVLEALFGGHDDIPAPAVGTSLIDAFSSEELIDTVIDEAHRYGITDPAREARIKVSRLAHIQANPLEEPAAYETFTI